MADKHSKKKSRYIVINLLNDNAAKEKLKVGKEK